MLHVNWHTYVGVICGCESLFKGCLSFSLLRSSIMCLRGARSSQGRAFRSSVIDLAVAEAKVPSHINCILCVHIYIPYFVSFLIHIGVLDTVA